MYQFYIVKISVYLIYGTKYKYLYMEVKMNNKEILKNNLTTIETANKGIKTFLASIIDEHSFVETDVFTAGKSYLDGGEALGDGVLTGYATISGNPVNIFAQNNEVLKGSFGENHAKKIKKVIAKAISTGTPLISVIDSNGARIGEGVNMLEAYSEVIAEVVLAKENIPHICIIKGACVGMTTAIASLADFVYMSKESVMSVNSPMVLAASELDYPKLNKILGYEQFSLKSDMANFTYNNAQDLGVSVKALLEFLAGDVNESSDDANRETPSLDKKYTVSGAFSAICDNGKFIELNSSYAKEVKTIFTKINSISVGILASDSTLENGLLTVDGILKATNFIEKCDANNLPIINLIDWKGIKSCVACEVSGLAQKLSKLMSVIANCEVETISVVTGNAIGLIYSTFVSKGMGFDYTLACVNAQISPISSEQAVSVIYADQLKEGKKRDELAKKYAELEGNPFISAKEGFIDNIILASSLRPYLASALMMLLGI